MARAGFFFFFFFSVFRCFFFSVVVHFTCYKIPEPGERISTGNLPQSDHWKPVVPVAGTPFDKITTRYDDWEVSSPPSVYFIGNFRIYLHIVSLVAILRNWV